MKRMLPRLSVSLLLSGFVFFTGAVDLASAYEQYSGGGIKSCAYCHGDFRSASYTSLVDGANWGILHNLHRTTMLSGDRNACNFAEDTFPVILGSSAGGTGLEPIGCVGCNGRNEDHNPANPDWPLGGRGAGLRQHHTKRASWRAWTATTTAGWARLQIHAATGELVCTLEARHHEHPGTYEESWGGRNSDGSPVASGVYFGLVSTAESAAAARMVLLR